MHRAGVFPWTVLGSGTTIVRAARGTHLCENSPYHIKTVTMYQFTYVYGTLTLEHLLHTTLPVKPIKESPKRVAARAALDLSGADVA